MPKFSIDLEKIVDSTVRKSFKLADVKDKIEKVAFDVVRFKDGNKEELWQIQNDEDGDYIVALYSDDDKIATASVATATNWSILVKNANLHFFYKNDYVCKIAGNQLGFTDNDLNLAKRYLPVKLADNKNLIKMLLKSADEDTRKMLASKYAELA